MHSRIIDLKMRPANAGGTIKDGVLQCEGEDYTDNFGWQWTQFSSTQNDSANGDTLSRDRLLLSLGLKAEDLQGKLVLEVGCGSGRFTEQLIAAGAIVCALDASAAVYVNARQNACDRAKFVLASVYSIPFEPRQFDIVLCLGVLQHTPSRRRTINALAEQVRPGGLLCVDSYRFTLRRLTPSYLMRPLFSYLPPRALRSLAHGYVDCWWPFRKIFRSKWSRGAAWLLSPIAPVLYYWSVSTNRADDFLKEWAYLETHDFLSPKHDVPQTLGSLRRLASGTGLKNIEVIDLTKCKTPDNRTVSGFYVVRALRQDA